MSDHALNITVSSMLGGAVRIELKTDTPLPEGTLSLTMDCTPAQAEALARSLTEMADKARTHGGTVQ